MPINALQNISQVSDVYKMEVKMKVLVVVDMQNDFIDGSLGTKEAEEIVGAVENKIKSLNSNDKLYFTMDTHEENYLDTQEGKNLPVMHCVRNSEGWQINESLKEYADKLADGVICKPCFGSYELAHKIAHLNMIEKIDEIELVGLCTDICVISNAILLKSTLPEVVISVDSSCCAGVTPESHNNALEAMKMCQIVIK